MTQIIYLTDIPNWLKSSELYETLKENDKENESFIYTDKFDKKIVLDNVNKLSKYLEIFRFWLVKECPFKIYKYILKNKKIININELKKIFYDLSFINEIELLVNTKKKDLVLEAVKHGYLHLLKYLYEKKYIFYEKACEIASEKGYLEILKFLYKINCKFNEWTITYAVKFRHYHCLKYLLSNGEFNQSKYILYYAIDNNDLDSLKLAIEYEIYVDPDCVLNSVKNINILKYLMENNHKFKYNDGQEYIKENICNRCISYGNLETLTYLFNKGYYVTCFTCYLAGLYGKLDMLIFLHENGCPWDKSTTKFSKQFNHIECYNYAIENGCEE